MAAPQVKTFNCKTVKKTHLIEVSFYYANIKYSLCSFCEHKNTKYKQCQRKLKIIHQNSPFTS